MVFKQILAVVCRCFSKKIFLKILQYSQENTCVAVFFLIKLQTLGLKKRELLKKTGVLCEYFNPIKFRAPLISVRFIFAPLILAQLTNHVFAYD